MFIYIGPGIFFVGFIYILFLEFFIIRRKIKFDPQNEKFIRKEVTKIYLFGISRSNFLLIIVALATALIGASSAQILLQERNQGEIFDELSVKPHVDISLYNSTDGSAGYEFDSDGLGPAVIKWSSVSVDDKPEINWEGVTKDLNFPTPTNFRYFNPTQGASYTAGRGPYAIYQIAPGNNATYFLANSNRIKIRICYCSQYSEIDRNQCWQTANKFELIKNTCDPIPTVLFGQEPVFVSPNK